MTTNQCIWEFDDHYCFYETDCKHSFQFMDDGIDENNFKYCPYCGRKIVDSELIGENET